MKIATLVLVAVVLVGCGDESGLSDAQAWRDDAELVECVEARYARINFAEPITVDEFVAAECGEYESTEDCVEAMCS
jgi:hypothetical protein